MAPLSRSDKLVVDVCVIGAGPSGSATARRLAHFGYKVALIDRPRRRRRGRLECLAPSIAPLLDALDLREVTAAIGEPCACLHRRWAEDQDTISQEGAILIERDAFDQALLRSAANAGVIILSPARAHPPTRAQHGWRIRIDAQHGTMTLGAAFVVNAGGRTHGGTHRRQIKQPAAAALSWRWIEDDAPAAAEMFLEAMADCWLWAARLPGGHAGALAFVDLASCRGLDHSRRAARFNSILQRSSFFRRATPLWAEGVEICDASFHVDELLATSDMIKVGDAATALDPISSQGLQSALRSTVQGSAVVHTILSGGDVDASISFYRRSQETGFARHLKMAAQAYAEPAAKYGTGFWRIRSGEAAEDRRLSRSGAALSELTEETRLCLSTQTRIVLAPTMANNWIRTMEAVVHPSLPEPVAYLGNLPLTPVLRLIEDRQSFLAVRAACTNLMPLEQVAAVLDWALRNGIVVAKTSES